MFLNVEKYLNLDLGKFQVVNKILTVLFRFSLILLYFSSQIPSFLTVFSNTSKYFTYFVKVILSIEVSNLAYLLKL